MAQVVELTGSCCRPARKGASQFTFGESRRQRACPTTATHRSNGILVAESTTRATYSQVAVNPGRRSERQASRVNTG